MSEEKELSPAALGEELERLVVDGPESADRAGVLIERLEALAGELRAQQVLSRVERFFESRPEQAPVELRWGGASNSYVVASFKTGLHDASCLELERMLTPWSWDAPGSGRMGDLRPQSALRELGELMLGAEGFARWRAQVERARLDASVDPGVKRASGLGL